MNDDIKLNELIAHEVLAQEGVSRFVDASITENLTQAVFGRDSYSPGIRIQTDDDQMIISIEIIVYYGTNIPQLCYDIQTRIKRYLEELAGLNVRAVNIRIEGIDERSNDEKESDI